MVSGIYKITCRVTGKIYIGQSQSLGARKRQHWDKLRLGKHKNKKMQADWNEYGAANFSFDILEKCAVSDLNEREIYWINKYDATNPSVGYNKQVGGAHKNKGLVEEPRYKNRTKYKKS